ncbi:hypothetical protein [Celerinatantimonas yamalensis]|uniref:Uncharacterized protein n=1 Tax=Celerinatantimonas yamalensis TaxID=559956 RepID=A0ABW9G6Z3_9GAMM
MKPSFNICSITRQDYANWRPLWDGYNAFYGRFSAGRGNAGLDGCSLG